LALLGPASVQVLDAIGVTQAGSMSALGSGRATLVQQGRLVVRHDFAGVFGAELYIDAADAEAVWNRLLEIGRPVGLRSVGHSAVEALRIEAGLPASVQDIDEEVLPAETQQLERAVSYKKGCYLGQEVVERMRSHQVLARKLVGFRLSGPASSQQVLRAAGSEAGRITSVCESPAAAGWIGLGYVKLQHAGVGTVLRAGSDSGAEAIVHNLPFRVPSTS
jgi:folate-binding protein YgfZ